MTRVLLTLCLLGLFTKGISQQLPEPYKLDGSISWMEKADTAQMTYVVKEGSFFIKEASEYYYIGIQTNIATIGNVYYLDEDKVVVLHASAALGAVSFVRSGQHWVPEPPRFTWTHRDPEFIDDDDKISYVPLDKYYDQFNWVANTVTAGSGREMEFIVSKEIAGDYENLRVSFSQKHENGEASIIVVNGSPLTADPQVDTRIHNGYLPENVNFLHHQ